MNAQRGTAKDWNCYDHPALRRGKKGGAMVVGRGTAKDWGCYDHPGLRRRRGCRT
ncbi:MAG: hypothetical protein OXC91_02635 [Rhodobacteraceae bacterium]|nr:hypothetical protein [Paracoccaceae bacterium]